MHVFENFDVEKYQRWWVLSRSRIALRFFLHESVVVALEEIA